VPPEKTFVGVIRDRYPATLNLGMAGNGPLAELAGLKEYGEALRPRVVLWFYTENNDLSDLQKEKRTPLLLRYLKDDFRQGLVDLQEDIDHALVTFVQSEKAARMATESRKPEAQSRRIDQDRLLGFVKLSRLRENVGLVYGSTPEEEANLADLHGPTMDLFREILMEAKTLTERTGGRLYFVYLPGWYPFVNITGVLEEKHNEVLAIVRDLKIPAIDLREMFQSHRDPLSLFPFRASGHYTEEGHRLVAEEVFRHLSKSRPIASPMG
jgi:hypothetical protein